MILVTGATGHFGSMAIDHLLKKGVSASEIHALVRDTTKAQSLKDRGIEPRVADYTDYNSVVKALDGVEKLLLISSNDRGSVENRTAQHINVIKAAKDARVRHIVYTSFIRNHKFEETAISSFQNSHVRSEEFLKASGIDYTILQNGIYLEMIPIFAGAKVAETGLIMYPAKNGKASWVLREELAEAAAHVLTSEGHENKIYSLTNTESVSFNEIARELSGTLGKEIEYQSPEPKEFETSLKHFGVPDLYIGMLSMWAVAQAQGALNSNDATLASFLKRQPTTVKQFIERVYK